MNNMNNMNKIKITKVENRTFKIDFYLINYEISNEHFKSQKLIEYLYLFNSNYFQDGSIKSITDNNYSIYLLIKPICKELGLFNNRFIYLLLKNNFIGNKINVFGINIPVEDKSKINTDYIKHLEDKTILATPLSGLDFEIEKINNNIMKIVINFELESNFYMFPMFETIIKGFLKNIFKNFQSGYFNVKYNDPMLGSILFH